MIISADQLSPQTLRALIEEFITRNGAIQGHSETPLDQMIAQVLSQLRNGKAVIVFDEEDETCSIVPRQNI